MLEIRNFGGTRQQITQKRQEKSTFSMKFLIHGLYTVDIVENISSTKPLKVQTQAN